MCATVLFGDDRQELFNLDCKLIHFIHNLKERCGLDTKDSVDLMDSSGTVMNLEGREYSLDRASSLLKDRQNYVLVRVGRGVDGESKYTPLLNNCQSHPDLKELLRKLSNDTKQRVGQSRGRRPQRKQKKQEQKQK